MTRPAFQTMGRTFVIAGVGRVTDETAFSLYYAVKRPLWVVRLWRLSLLLMPTERVLGLVQLHDLAREQGW